jgi:serine phosphatase RsbU (regulator of sigma subunit)
MIKIGVLLLNKTSAKYGNINEGTYTFKVKACSPEGVWSEPTIYSFKVLPPWYRTWWMYLAYVMLAILFIRFIVKWNSRKLISQKKHLEQEVKKATSLIRTEKEKVEEANLLVLEQKKVVEEKNKDMLDSIHYAKRIQDAMLKVEEHRSEHLPAHFVLFLPKDIVSGDFHWAYEKQPYWYVAAVDCTGHGVPGAFMSLLGISFLNDILSESEAPSPAQVLDLLRDKIMKELRQSGESGGNKDGMDISIIRLCLETKGLQWAGANNPLLMIKNGEMIEIKGDKQPIGYYPDAKPFTNHVLQLRDTQYLYVFSDGYPDQFGGPDGKKFKMKQLKDVLFEIHLLPMEEQKEKLKKIFLDWKGNLEQIDDVCVIGLKIENK